MTGGLNGVTSMGSVVSNGDPMNGFNMPGPSSVVSGGQVNGLQTMSSIQQSKRKINVVARGA